MTASRKPPISASRKFQENENIVTWTEMHVMIHLYRRSETQLAFKLSAKDFACRSKAKAKPTKTRICQLFHKNKTCWERIWTDVEQGEYSLFDYAVSKKLIHRLRHGKILNQGNILSPIMKYRRK